MEASVIIGLFKKSWDGGCPPSPPTRGNPVTDTVSVVVPCAVVIGNCVMGTVSVVVPHSLCLVKISGDLWFYM